MPMMSIYNPDSNAEYQYSSEEGLLVNKALQKVCESEQNLIREIYESIGGIEFSDEINYNILKEDSETEKTNDSFIENMIKYAALNIDAIIGLGDSTAWANAVKEIASWYVANVHQYNQAATIMCPLVNNRMVRMDCSGFVTACLWRYGAFSNLAWPLSSRLITSDSKTAEGFEKAGFTKLTYTGTDILQPFDIMSYNGHVEIYAGLDGNTHKAYSWGRRHDIDGLPCYMAHVRQGYDIIWRCQGGGSLSILKNIMNGQEYNFANLHVNVGNPADVCKACYQTFRDAGCTDAAAKGICANIAAESNFNPTVVTWDGVRKTMKFGVGGGLCGFYFLGALPELAKHAWGANGIQQLNSFNEKVKNSGLPYPTTPVHPANTKHIMNKFGGFPFSLDQQLKYLVSILNSKNYSFIKLHADASKAAYDWEKYYERPARLEDRWAKHGNTVLKYLAK